MRQSVFCKVNYLDLLYQKSGFTLAKWIDNVAFFDFLGELLAPLLDIIYSSDEKDKVVPLLSSVMINVVPYLKNHSRSNLASFRACSKLLASLSEYQNTRKAQ